METYNVSATVALIVQSDNKAGAEGAAREKIDELIEQSNLNAYRDFIYVVNPGIAWDDIEVGGSR